MVPMYGSTIGFAYEFINIDPFDIVARMKLIDDPFIVEPPTFEKHSIQISTPAMNNECYKHLNIKHIINDFIIKDTAFGLILKHLRVGNAQYFIVLNG